MAGRPTVADVARRAGVGVATVDRVLNARAPVRAETARRVYEAAEAIGYHGVGLMRSRAREALPSHRFGFLLQRPDQTFYRDFAGALEAATSADHAGFRAQCTLSFLPSQKPGDIADHLRQIARKVDAVGMVAVDHPLVTAAVAEVQQAGKPVFSLLSDFAPGVRRGYFGTDNRKVGRTAGWLVARAARAPGNVAMFVGSHRFHGHEMREIGFRSYLREAAPGLSVVDTQVSLEDDDLAHEATLDLLRRYPDLAAIYIAGGGTEGAIAALRAEKTAGRIVLVCNENNAVTRAALADNFATAAIATPLAGLSAALVARMAAALARSEAEAAAPTFLPFDILVSENI